MKRSNPSKHIKDNVGYGFNWSVLANKEHILTKHAKGALHEQLEHDN